MDNQKLGNVKVKIPVKFKYTFKKRVARLTPWSCPAEFDYVGRCFAHATSLFSSSPSSLKPLLDDNHQQQQQHQQQQLPELQYAIQRVFLWKTRATNGCLPHAVDMTCSLSQILLQDAMTVYTTTNSKRMSSFQLFNQHSIKLSYATVIIRGVNGIADSMQKNRAKCGASVASLCSQIGLPLWIVDLRHDSAHNELPCLVSLRLAAQTLVGFFLQNYWTVVEDLKMIHWRMQGESLLKECKGSCKELDRLIDIGAGAGAGAGAGVAAGSCSKDDELEPSLDPSLQQYNANNISSKDNTENQMGESSSYGMYSILMEESINKTKKQKTTPTTTTTKLRDRIHGRTPRQCLQDYIEKIPIDLGMEMLLQYLFYGGISDAPQGRGILIPGSTVAFPETINSVRKMRERYSVILIYMTECWPGFLHAATNSITELIILLEGKQQQEQQQQQQQEQQQQQQQHGRDETPMDDDCDFGRSRKLFFLKYWFIYLLSNEFFCYLQLIEVTWKGSKNIRERPREKWSDDLISFLESCAPWDALKQARLPLHSIYKRFISEGGGPVSHELATFLETVLGKECKVHDLQMMGKGKNGSGSGSESHEYQIGGVDHSSTMTSSWTVCTDWEPCAIGTLPGHVEHVQ